MSANILLAAAPATASAAIERALTGAGHRLHVRRDARAALAVADAVALDLVLVDVRLPPDPAPLAVFGSRSGCAVVALAGADGEELAVRFVEDGADDFLIAPFTRAHLAARVRVALRRARPVPRVLTVGGITVDLAARRAVCDGRALSLSRLEFDFLAYLAARAGEVVSREDLVAAVWCEPYAGHDRVIDVHLSCLRRKLGESAARPRHLHTVRNVGVRLQAG
ncbi:response regulator transcription factor [Phytomonospora sp. NPDC050363]|uniref:winged helix-turn-helix domain-containing protein n=1 Tax=Phytomonospora sp. NPDC050363 TaxID=3155642 RepID=UPI003410F81F